MLPPLEILRGATDLATMKEMIEQTKKRQK
jgi:hypothetical protein